MIYSYTSPDEITNIFKKNNPTFCKTEIKDESVMNTPVSFDIESTSYTDSDGNKYAFMYIWAFDIFDVTIIGRTWTEFVEMLETISEYFKLSPKKRMICFCHNFAFEFQWIRKWLNWKKVFSINQRKPVYAITENGIEFRCSYILTGYKLQTVGENLRNKIPKLVGDLDYSLCRHFKSYVSDEEIQYVIHDVKIVSQCIREKIKDENGICNIPLTKTGYVRRLCRARCLRGKGYAEYKKLMDNLTIEPDEYIIAKRAFSGGFTHANFWNVKKVHKNVTSMDFCSSYPACMIAFPYPMSKGKKIDIDTMRKEDFFHYINNKCCIFKIELHDVQSKNQCEDYISRSHCSVCENSEKKNVIVNNGRIHTAGKLITVITNIDFEIIQHVYDFDEDEIKLSDFYIYEKSYLPSVFVECIIDLYGKKTILKGVKGKEEEYLNGKENLNSLYGMCVTAMFRALFEYDCKVNKWNDEKEKEDRNEETKEEERKRLEKTINKENRKKGRFLFYLWGVFVTAYARRNLFTAIIECGTDYIYSDTDSVKITNFEKHKKYFDDYNKWITEKIETALKHHGIKPELARPKTIKGKEKPLGIWEFDGFYTEFKTLGAKRYLCHYPDGHYMLTVAGLSKQDGLHYMLERQFPPAIEKQGISIWEQFSNDLYIPAGHTGKMTHTYIDTEFTLKVTDYQGITAIVHEKSCVHLAPVEYSLNMDSYERFIAFINSFNEFDE